ncbi:DUF3833 family protein [Muricoccus radiodurans]|uniref:DUF3833 family protein n=1 Tax=Muricoccus radiodurans TaxID=2231721 RepID=UPI003CF709D5
MSGRRSLLLSLPALGAAAALPGCGTAPETFSAKGPPFRPEEFFASRLRSHGLFTTRLGAIERWFRAELIGAYDGTTLTFDEYFTYDDGWEDRRFWRLRRDREDASGNTWTGEATDATGPVRGVVSGNAFHLEHELNMLTLNGSRRKLGFDQWFVRVAPDTALSRAAVTWYGIQVGTAQVSFRRLTNGVNQGSVSAGQASRAPDPTVEPPPAPAAAAPAAAPPASPVAPPQPARPEPGRSVIAPRR